jgi:hypothetical protein
MEFHHNWSWLGASAIWFASSNALSSTSTTRLDFTSRCNVDAPRPPTSTTRFSFGLCRNIRAQHNEFDYFDFARTIGGPPTTTSTTCLDLKTSRNQLHLVELHRQIIAAPSTNSTVSSIFVHESS